MAQKFIPLLPGETYHIVNHAIAKENLFLSRDNYLFFLKKYFYYINPIGETFAYCLMPNHFHFLVRMKEEETLQSANRQFQLDREVPEPSIMPIDNEAYSDFLSKIFSNLLNSYAQAFNKQQKRRGSLFLKPFKRRKVDSMQYFKNAVHYIHPNPVAHGFSDSIWSNGSILLIKHGVLTRLQS